MPQEAVFAVITMITIHLISAQDPIERFDMCRNTEVTSSASIIEIVTPGYDSTPTLYPNDTRCECNIETDRATTLDKTLNVTISDIDLEICDDAYPHYDIINITSAYSFMIPYLTLTYCGGNSSMHSSRLKGSPNANEVFGSGNTIYSMALLGLVFKSDASIEKRGARLTLSSHRGNCSEGGLDQANFDNDPSWSADRFDNRTRSTLTVPTVSKRFRILCQQKGGEPVYPPITLPVTVTPQTTPSLKGNNAGAIAGGVIGAVVTVALVFALVILIRQRKLTCSKPSIMIKMMNPGSSQAQLRPHSDSSNDSDPRPERPDTLRPVYNDPCPGQPRLPTPSTADGKIQDTYMYAPSSSPPPEYKASWNGNQSEYACPSPYNAANDRRSDEETYEYGYIIPANRSRENLMEHDANERDAAVVQPLISAEDRRPMPMPRGKPTEVTDAKPTTPHSPVTMTKSTDPSGRPLAGPPPPPPAANKKTVPPIPPISNKPNSSPQTALKAPVLPPLGNKPGASAQLSNQSGPPTAPLVSKKPAVRFQNSSSSDTSKDTSTDTLPPSDGIYAPSLLKPSEMKKKQAAKPPPAVTSKPVPPKKHVGGPAPSPKPLTGKPAPPPTANKPKLGNSNGETFEVVPVHSLP